MYRYISICIYILLVINTWNFPEIQTNITNLSEFKKLWIIVYKFTYEIVLNIK